jgi:hypothetical protein
MRSAGTAGLQPDMHLLGVAASRHLLLYLLACCEQNGFGRIQMLYFALICAQICQAWSYGQQISTAQAAHVTEVASIEALQSLTSTDPAHVFPAQLPCQGSSAACAQYTCTGTGRLVLIGNRPVRS